MTKKPELLSPVNNFETLTAAIEAGADSVYFGLPKLNMRITANNFELNQLQKVVDTCHSQDVRAYLTLNTIVFDTELEEAEALIIAAKKAGIDAIICWDFGVAQLAKKHGLEVHLSTQASIANYEALKFYHSQGFRRFVLARELNLKQIESIVAKIKKEKLDAEIECFIHGAMCVSVSGRCFMSQFLYNKSANRGDCLQPCRREFRVTDKETGIELDVGNDYVLSPKDLCTIKILPKMINAGINAFKIEGRMKQADYVSKVTKAYREAIDFYFANHDKNDFESCYAKFSDEKLKELESVYNRLFHTGFYIADPSLEFTTLGKNTAAKTTKVYIGKIKKFYKRINVAEVLVQSEELNIGDLIAVIGPTTGYKECVVTEMQIDIGKPVTKAKKEDIAGVKLGFEARVNDKVFVIRKNTV